MFGWVQLLLIVKRRIKKGRERGRREEAAREVTIKIRGHSCFVAEVGTRRRFKGMKRQENEEKEAEEEKEEKEGRRRRRRSRRSRKRRRRRGGGGGGGRGARGGRGRRVRGDEEGEEDGRVQWRRVSVQAQRGVAGSEALRGWRRRMGMAEQGA